MILQRKQNEMPLIVNVPNNLLNQGLVWFFRGH
jgi:hypothetical protein